MIQGPSNKSNLGNEYRVKVVINVDIQFGTCKAFCRVGGSL